MVTFESTTIVVTFNEGVSTYYASQATTTTIGGHAIVLGQDINCGPFSTPSNDLNCVDSHPMWSRLPQVQVLYPSSKTGRGILLISWPRRLFL
ncbi:hypothetical protein BDN70DRAFT_118190 [Pholiota conissans]|uniref:Uncharacterized protein n=1 Tax=Pholiota conissans TaxID=109636 RepID=A0A9P6CRN2_9AGAR|nr:hypothetical protein BDN70DRAFT_118190 [Pholiota conissans]